MYIGGLTGAFDNFAELTENKMMLVVISTLLAITERSEEMGATM